MKSSKSKTIIQLSTGKVFTIKPKHKYIVIMPEDADLKHLAPALSEFCKPAAVFIIAARDLNSIKIAEIMKGGK